MKTLAYWLSLFAAIFLAGCSQTTLTGSWKDPGYEQRIDRIYVIGVSKQELHRRLLEEAFIDELLTYGVTSIPSYKDLPDADQADRAVIDARVQTNRVDTVLITRVLGKRTEQVVHPGHATYRSWPYYGPRRYDPAPYYRHYWSYYDRRYDMVYSPATVSEYQVVTAECNLYSAETGALVWSAQLETVMRNNFQKQITSFVNEVTRNLSEQGLL